MFSQSHNYHEIEDACKNIISNIDARFNVSTISEPYVSAIKDDSKEELNNISSVMANMFIKYTAGYTQTVDLILNGHITTIGKRKRQISSTVCINNINFSTLCEETCEIIYGTISIKYIPYLKHIKNEILLKAIELLSKRLQTQQKLTENIVWTIEKFLNTKDGVCI